MPFVFTTAMKDKLRDLGYSEDFIKKVKLDEAWRIINEGKGPPEHEAPAPELEAEAAAGSSEEDDADGREPDIAAAADTRPGEAAVQRAPKLEPKPNSRVPPSDPVERWR